MEGTPDEQCAPRAPLSLGQLKGRLSHLPCQKGASHCIKGRPSHRPPPSSKEHRATNNIWKTQKEALLKTRALVTGVSGQGCLHQEMHQLLGKQQSTSPVLQKPLELVSHEEERAQGTEKKA